MKRWSLLLVTTAVLLLTGWRLHHSARGGVHADRHVAARDGHDPLHSAAGSRYRQNQASHWRCCLLR
jgi:hypothetical protein